jgi:hypothetical protein
VWSKSTPTKNAIDTGLSLGGGLSGLTGNSEAKKRRRGLCRGLILSLHVLEKASLADARARWKDRSENDIRTELNRLDKDTGDRAKQKATGAMLSGKAEGNHYSWLRQQTHTLDAISDARAAEARGWVRETIHGHPTGRWVPEDGGDSCGPTAVAILYSYVVDKPMPEDRMRAKTAEYPHGYHAGGVGSGTYSSALADALNGLGHGVPKGWRAEQIGTDQAGLAAWVGAHVSKRTPVIFNIGWHFVVGVEVVNGKLICADPWDGIQAAPLSALPGYPVSHRAFNGWVVYHP